MVKRVLITGASGLLGKYLMRTHPDHWMVCGTWLNTFLPYGYRMDVTMPSSIQPVFDKFQPDIVIHCAALGSVDYCENYQQEALDVNVVGTENVLKASMERNAKFVFISSNAVYDGEHAPYTEYAPRRPVNAYGTMKCTAEDMVMDLHPHRWMIIRPILLYGIPRTGGRGNWVTRALDFMCNGTKLYVVDDTVTQPTYAMDCARAIWTLLERGYIGTFNVGSKERISLYQFVECIADVYDMSMKKVIAVKSDHFRKMAPRPRDTTYDLTKLWDLDIEAVRPKSIASGLRRMHDDPS